MEIKNRMAASEKFNPVKQIVFFKDKSGLLNGQVLNVESINPAFVTNLVSQLYGILSISYGGIQNRIPSMNFFFKSKVNLIDQFDFPF